MRARQPFLSALALHLQGKGNILGHRHMRKEAEMLEHHAQLAAAQFDQARFAGGEDVLAFNQDFAAGGVDQMRDAAHERGFAGAGKAHDDE